MIYFVRKELGIVHPDEFMRVPVKWATILMEEGVLVHREAERAAKSRPRNTKAIQADEETTENLIRKIGPVKGVAVEMAGSR